MGLARWGRQDWGTEGLSTLIIGFTTKAPRHEVTQIYLVSLYLPVFVVCLATSFPPISKVPVFERQAQFPAAVDVELVEDVL